jgi:hypothetical protein
MEVCTRLAERAVPEALASFESLHGLPYDLEALHMELDKMAEALGLTAVPLDDS